MTKKRWKTLPPDRARRYLEPGPVVLLSTVHRDERAIMTLGWHMMLGYDLVGTYLWQANRSHALARASRECVINIPTEALIRPVVGIGNCTGADTDKFDKFRLTAAKADRVGAPLIAECYANFECKVIDVSMVAKYNFFILEVAKAHVATSPKYPATVHYRGDGVFMLSGRNVSYRRFFKSENL